MLESEHGSFFRSQRENKGSEARTMKKVLISIDEANFSIDPRYKIKEILGKGSYGTVCLAIDTKDATSDSEGVKIAIKKVSNIFDKQVLLKRAVRELKLMRHFKGHRNIVNLIDLDIVYIQPYEGLYCFQELVDYDLTKVIYSGIQFSEFHIQSFLYQILCGLKYIHSADVIHRDLKPGNVLVTIQGTLKICDFGLARGVNPEFLKQKSTPITNYVATRWYRAPELMLSNKMYTKAVDLWAVGCILAELYGRRPLFMGKDQMDQLHKIFRILGTPSMDVVKKFQWKFAAPPRSQFRGMSLDSIYPFASYEALNLLSCLLNWDPSERPDVEQTISHAFLHSVRTPNAEPTCSKIFDFSFESSTTSMVELKHLLHEEVRAFKGDRTTPAV